MTRKELRSVEQDWRQTRHSNNKTTPKISRRSVELKFVLKLLIALAVIGVGILLWESKQRCESMLGDSIYCVD